MKEQPKVSNIRLSEDVHTELKVKAAYARVTVFDMADALLRKALRMKAEKRKAAAPVSA